jgi:hypothetical protein
MFSRLVCDCGKRIYGLPVERLSGSANDSHRLYSDGLTIYSEVVELSTRH